MCLAIPGKVLSISGGDPIMRTGEVSFGGVVHHTNLAMVPEAGVGDYVLVHVGVAIAVIDELEAARTIEYVRELEAAGESVDGRS